MDTSVFEELGLTPAEISVYIALLELGTSPAGEILIHTKLQNSTVHRSLNSLIERGLVSFIMNGRRKEYSAGDPENFKTFIKDKMRRFDALTPELEELQRRAKKEIGATVYKGKRGVTEFYTKLMTTQAKEYNTFGGGSEVTHDVMGETWWRNMHAKRLAIKLPCRQVFDETIRDVGERLNKNPITEIRFLPSEFEQLQETIIVGDYVGIAIFTDTPYCTLIHDKDAADSYRKIFEILWKMAKQ